MRGALLLLLIQTIGTITPVFLFPHEVFNKIHYAPTLEGQYIIKNLVLISAGLVIGATVRGGTLVADPPVRDQPLALVIEKSLHVFRDHVDFEVDGGTDRRTTERGQRQRRGNQ